MTPLLELSLIYLSLLPIVVDILCRLDHRQVFLARREYPRALIQHLRLQLLLGFAGTSPQFLLRLNVVPCVGPMRAVVVLVAGYVCQANH